MKEIARVPCGQRSRVNYFVKKQQPVQVINFVLKCARGETENVFIDWVAFAVPCGQVQPGVACYLSANTWHRQTTFHVFKHVIVERRKHWVDQNGQRHARLVWVTRVVVNLDSTDALMAQHLGGCKTCAICMTHGLDEVIYKRLSLGQCKLLASYFFCHPLELWVTHCCYW